MIPSSFVRLHSLPLTSNGKIDRKILPIPNPHLDSLEYIAPKNIIEKQVAKIFENLLDIEGVSAISDFFSLGGHSLLAARAVAQINSLFCVNLPIKIIFHKPTICLIAREIEFAIRGEVSFAHGSQFRSPKTTSFDLSPSQQRFWLLDQKVANKAAYSIPFLIEFMGDLDIPLLRKAVNTIIERHEILRAFFIEGAEGPRQIISTDKQAEIQCEKLKDIKDIQNLILEEAQRPFDLKIGPLFRFLLIRFQKNKHLFLLNFHHIIFDGYSLNVFLEELKSFYEAHKVKKTDTLKPLNMQYIDYIYWQNHHYEKDIEEEQGNWWVKRLRDAPAFLNLPLDRPRPPVQTSNGALFEFLILNSRQLAALKRLSQENRTTIFTTLLAAFHVFLYRYTAQNDFIIGIPVSGRNHHNFDSNIGCFINTIALRITSNSNSNFLDFLACVRNEFFEAIKHQEVSFERVLEKYKIDRSFSHSLLFQVMFNMLPKTEVENINDVQLRVRNIDRKMAHLDLSLSVQESQNRLRGSFEYNTDLFLSRTIKRMATHFQKLVKEIVKDPHRKIGKLPLLSYSEMKKQTIEWNKQPVTYHKRATIIQLFEKWAEHLPEALAIACKGKNYSYCEINRQANKIAHALINSGIKSEDKVAVYLGRSVDFIATVLGILKAGGVFVPLDPLAPKERTDFILKELKPFCILTNRGFSTKFSESKMLYTDQLPISSDDNPSIPISGKQLAYIIYTSGSTGRPKGVEIEYRSINDRVLWKNAAYPLSTSDVMLHTYSLIFDGSIINYFWPLCAGASLIIASEEEQIDPTALISLIKKYKVTTMDLLPSLLQGIIDEHEIIYCYSLKYVFSGGEALPGELISQFYKKCNARLYNTYGPTEATVEASVWKCTPNFSGPIAPIGKPIAGAKLYILDSDQNIVPIGVPGELHIGGMGLARGYLNSPKLTGEKFTPNIFGGILKNVYIVQVI